MLAYNLFNLFTIVGHATNTKHRAIGCKNLYKVLEMDAAIDAYVRYSQTGYINLVSSLYEDPEFVQLMGNAINDHYMNAWVKKKNFK